ncbi:MAG: nitrate/nitrite transporter NrtS [Gammaproteobacteria bacterium]
MTTTTLREAAQLAASPAVVRRSARVALVVGSVLVAINHGDRLLGGSLSGTDGVKIVLTYCVPYCVSTYAAVGAMLQMRRAERS